MNPKVFFITMALLMMYQQPQGLLAQNRATQQRGRAPAPPPPATGPLTVSDVIEGLYSLGSSRAEELVAKRGVKFEGSPDLLRILKEFGASDRLLNLIPRPPAPPAKKFAGPLTVICEPKDCAVIVDDKYYGFSEQGRKSIRGLTPGTATIQIFSDGYERRTEKAQLVEDMPLDVKITFETNAQARQQLASDTLLSAIRAIGGGLLLADVEGAGTMDWLDNEGKPHVWDLTFVKRPGQDLSITFKTQDGQCVATIQRQGTKQDCRGKLKNSAEDVAAQTAAAFQKYQIQESIQQFLGQKLALVENDDRRLMNSDGNDPVSLSLGPDGLPSEVLYKSGVKVTYSDYLRLGAARYPGRMTIGQSDRPPVWIFKLGSVRNSAGRNP